MTPYLAKVKVYFRVMIKNNQNQYINLDLYNKYIVIVEMCNKCQNCGYYTFQFILNGKLVTGEPYEIHEDDFIFIKNLKNGITRINNKILIDCEV